MENVVYFVVGVWFCNGVFWFFIMLRDFKIWKKH